MLKNENVWMVQSVKLKTHGYQRHKGFRELGTKIAFVENK